ncbi:hypothetical protein BGZ65_003241 [Modicella reniformis]|uniref:Uncharacterized protein n=1 Tax=Modicella reniformis TaxID=1440133 RepID=A0A9P6IKP9_9FUNG|nr:hypothetical protein BGZ65_003241 [Modicella reniformis]
MARKGSSIGSMAFRHGSLDKGKDIQWMEENLRNLGIGTSEEIAYGSFPEDVHHQHSLYSAPLNTGRESKVTLSSSPGRELPFGPDPRPIPSLSNTETSSGRPGRLLRLGSGSSVTSFTLPRLRTRADDNESLNEVNSTDGGSVRRGRRHDEDEDDDEDEEEEEGSRELPPGRGRLNPGSTTTPHDYSMAGVGGVARTVPGGVRGQGMMPLTGPNLDLRSQSKSPSLGSHHGHGGNGGNGNDGGSSSPSPHPRLFGRSTSTAIVGTDNNNNGSNSRLHSAAHSRVGSSNDSSIHQNSIENPNLLRRPGSGSGFAEDYNMASASSTPPMFPSATTGAGAFDAMLEGRRMSRGGSDRGMGNGVNSSHSDSRGSRIEGW